MSMSDSKQKYKKYCEQNRSIPIFLSYDWLSMLAKNDQWDVALVEKGGELFAALPYVWEYKWGFKIISMPLLTPYLGIWMKYPEGQKEGTRLSFEKEIMFEVISNIGAFSYFKQHLLPSVSNGLPFHWNGFRQTTRYTYVLERPLEEETIYEGLQQNIRRQIKKGQKIVKVVDSININKLQEIKSISYSEKGKKLPVSEDYLVRIFKYCLEHKCGKLLSAEDENGDVHAMMLLVWDQEVCYYLYGATLPSFKNSGAMSLLMWESIKLAAEKGLSFNFEGSMIESVERFFRSFGAKQVPYLAVEKYNSAGYRLLSSVKSFIS